MRRDDWPILALSLAVGALVVAISTPLAIFALQWGGAR